MCRPVCVLLFTSMLILSALVISRQRPVASEGQGQSSGQGHAEVQGQSHSRIVRSGQGQSLHRAARDVSDGGNVEEEGVSTKPPSPGHQHRRGEERREKVEMLQAKVARLENNVQQALRYVSEHQREGKCVAAQCPVGSIRFGCQCYMFVLHQRLKWEEARRYCHKMGGHLLVANSDGASKNIKRFAKPNLGKRGMRKVNFYTGLILTTKHSKEPAFLEEHRGSKRADGWYWQRGVGLSSKPVDPKLASKYWAPGHPVTTNHTSGEPKGFEPSCMMMSGVDSFKWHSVHCAMENHFICEWEATRVRKTKRRNKREEDSQKAIQKLSRRKRDANAQVDSGRDFVDFGPRSLSDFGHAGRESDLEDFEAESLHSERESDEHEHTPNSDVLTLFEEEADNEEKEKG